MKFEDALKEQVLLLDGAMGTMVQSLNVTDATFGGSLFRMLTDLLTFARPEDLENIHLQYLRAGANLIETTMKPTTTARPMIMIGSRTEVIRSVAISISSS